jgi:lysophospholipase L1-like esterase
LAAFFNAINIRRLAAVALLLLAGCGDDDNGGGAGPTPPTAPQITCPADVSVKGVTGTSQAVTYAAPVVTNGTPPVTSTCNRASGSTFPLGTTPVSCTATDALQRTATCSFNVTLSGFSLSVKKFEAFGDSLTEGEVGRPSFIDAPNAYPTKLQILFDQAYPGQGVTVINRGIGLHVVEQTVGEIRKYVPADRPDAVLILSGFNNLTQTCPPGGSATVLCGNGTEAVKIGILDCIRKARESSSTVNYVFVSTLTPPGATGSNRIDKNAIIEANNKIKQIVAQERATLVDSYAAFLGHEADYVNVDGLHLKPAGYQALADTFFGVIQATIPQTPLFGIAR